MSIGGGASPFRGAANLSMQGSSTCARARGNTEREIQRHIRILSAAKEQVRRARDDMSKEAAAISVAIREGNHVNAELGSQRASYSRQLGPDATAAMLDAVKKHVVQMAATGVEITDLMSFARQANEELLVGQQKLQHLEGLLDCAIDIDIQCAAGAAPTSPRGAHSVIVSGSPLFPGLTIHDSDVVLADSNDLCARAGRLTTMLRKATATASNLTSHSLTGLLQTTTTQSKMLAESYAVSLRQYNGIVFEHNKTTMQLAQYEMEEQQLTKRLNQVKKTLSLRDNASTSLALSRGRTDVVKDALLREKGELEQRLAEIARRVDKLNGTLQRFDDDKSNIEGKMHTCKKNAEQVLRTKALIEEISPKRQRRPLSAAPR